MGCSGCKKRARLFGEAVADLRAGNHQGYVDKMRAIGQTIKVDINTILAKLHLPLLDLPAGK